MGSLVGQVKARQDVEKLLADKLHEHVLAIQNKDNWTAKHVGNVWMNHAGEVAAWPAVKDTVAQLSDASTTPSQKHEVVKDVIRLMPEWKVQIRPTAFKGLQDVLVADFDMRVSAMAQFESIETMTEEQKATLRYLLDQLRSSHALFSDVRIGLHLQRLQKLSNAMFQEHKENELVSVCKALNACEAKSEDFNAKAAHLHQLTSDDTVFFKVAEKESPEVLSTMEVAASVAVSAWPEPSSLFTVASKLLSNAELTFANDNEEEKNNYEGRQREVKAALTKLDDYTGLKWAVESYEGVANTVEGRVGQDKDLKAIGNVINKRDAVVAEADPTIFATCLDAAKRDTLNSIASRFIQDHQAMAFQQVEPALASALEELQKAITFGEEVGTTWDHGLTNRHGWTKVKARIMETLAKVDAELVATKIKGANKAGYVATMADTRHLAAKY